MSAFVVAFSKREGEGDAVPFVVIVVVFVAEVGTTGMALFSKPPERPPATVPAR